MSTDELDEQDTPAPRRAHPRDERTERRWQFDNHRLEAHTVALSAMVLGDRVAEDLPPGYGKLKDQLERALQKVFTQTSEAAARTGAERLARFRAARAEAGEAAAVLEGLERLGVADPERVDVVQGLLWRLCAMFTRLARLRR